MLETKIKEEINKLQGPIIVFGAGGFIGANLVRQLLQYREDIYAVTSKPFVPWRLDDINPNNILHCDITKKEHVELLFEKYQFKTIFDLAAYGAYSKQDIVEKIYETNFIGLLNLLEVCSKFSINAFIHAGSSSEYGLNCAAPKEDAVLEPNSHYAVSKVSASYLIKFYGIIKEMPVLNLRYYSVYGPYEEPDRLIPKLIDEGRKGNYPPLVEPEISRDFIYIDDIVLATLKAANADYSIVKGMSFNIASGIKKTIKDVVFIIKDIFNIPVDPSWGNMPNRKWDLKEWYGDPSQTEKFLGWKNETSLKEGLTKTRNWQSAYSQPLYAKKLVQDNIRFKLSAVIACYKDAQAMPIMHQRLTAVFKR